MLSQDKEDNLEDSELHPGYASSMHHERMRSEKRAERPGRTRPFSSAGHEIKADDEVHSHCRRLSPIGMQETERMGAAK